jgi:hypothetical protein
LEEWRGSTGDLKFLKSGDDVSSSVLTADCREMLGSNDDVERGGGGEFITSDHIGISSTMGLCVPTPYRLYPAKRRDERP